MMRPLAMMLAGCLVIACKDETEVRTRNIQSELHNSSGDVALADGGSLQFSVTSESYKQWYRAHQGLDRRIASRFGALLQPASPTERSIERAVEYLESEPKARDAIQRTGMSIREFVVTTVALEQEMRVASERGDRPVDTMAMAVPYPGMDSMYPPTYTPVYPPPTYPVPAYPTPGYPPPGYPPTTTPTPYPPGYTPTTPVTPPAYPVLPERRVDSTRRVDTVYLPQRDSVRRSVTPGRTDTLWTRRDSLLPRRDTLVRRDTTIRRDTIVRRDTLARPRPPRDTLRPDTIPPRARLSSK